MAHPALWPNKIFFYPIGNTPAVCLTSELPPEQSADILLLGCGDVRSVLYTVHADLGASSRKLDFTCCDWEPAILARNILLYTLVADLSSENADKDISRIWNFYYHFFIDKDTLNVLLRQCQRLVDLSVDISKWNSSKYGTFLRFCTADSLSAIRKHWLLYVETTKLPTPEKDSLKRQFQAGNSSNDRRKMLTLTSVRSAGPLWVQLGDMGAKQFGRYWETGVTFDGPQAVAAANLVNPTFAYSAMGLGFELHYGSDPLLSFHLSQALAPTKGSNSSVSASISSLVESAMTEFKAWCRTFNGVLKSQSAALVIRFFAGDALAFCKALHYCEINNAVDTPVYSMAWSSALIKLDEGDYGKGAPSRHAPLQFSVVDTSNLADHLGLLNILVACRPLMQRNPSSVLRTDTLLPSNEKGMAGDGFADRLCGDVAILSMILDLIPVSYASNFSSRSNVHETVMLMFGAPGSQFHEQVSWRIASMSDSEVVPLALRADQRLKFDEKELALFLYDVYLRMFANENRGAYRSGASPWVISRLLQVHYVRFSFAYLLRFVKDRAQVDWETFINNLHDFLISDQILLVGKNNLLDLFCDVHLLGVHSFAPLLITDSDSLAKEGPLKGWKDMPSVVCITFQVPRKFFKPLEDVSWRELGTIILLCSLVGDTSGNLFQHYQSFFGRVSADYGDDSRQEPFITFDEDPDGIRGSSPVVFSFYVPTGILGIDPSLQVTVSIRPNPIASSKLTPALGPLLTIHSASLTDREHVHITRERPGNQGELRKLQTISFTPPAAGTPQSNAVKINMDSAARHVITLTGRANVINGKMKGPDDTVAEVQQISPQAVKVSFGKCCQVVSYPLPIDASKPVIRIARAAHPSYVEVDVKISCPERKLGMSLNPFPIVKYNGALSLWNIHYIALDRLPALDLSNGRRLEFVTLHTNMAFSDRERYLLESEAKGSLKGSDLDVITHVKQSIHDLFAYCCGLKSKPLRVFALTDPNNGGIYTLIFLNEVRLDLASHTIIADAVILPLTVNLVKSLSTAIWQLTDVVQIKTDPEELRAWKHLLPTFAERCRTWKHTAHCEYLSKGVPVSEEMERSPLCSCGKGKNLGPFAKNRDWKPFAPHCTRVAISPLFAVQFFDTIGRYRPSQWGKGRICTCLLLCGIVFSFLFSKLLR